MMIIILLGDHGDASDGDSDSDREAGDLGDQIQKSNVGKPCFSLLLKHTTTTTTTTTNTSIYYYYYYHYYYYYYYYYNYYYYYYYHFSFVFEAHTTPKINHHLLAGIDFRILLERVPVVTTVIIGIPIVLGLVPPTTLNRPL